MGKQVTAGEQPGTVPPTDTKFKIAQAEATLQRVGSWIAAADQKATILLGFAGVILGAGLLQFSVIHAAIDPAKPAAYRWSVGVFLVLALLATAACAIGALSSNWPRIASAGQSLTYFGTIQSRPPNEFREQFLAQDESQLLDDLIEQVHANSGIAHRKHRAIQRASALMIFGLVSWLILFLHFIWA